MTVIKKPQGTITSKVKAMEIASNWHGGQGSAFYSFASTGNYVENKYKDYIDECDDCLKIARNKQQTNELNKLKKWFNYKHYEANKK